MKDIAGVKYGKLTVVGIVGENKEGRRKWLCQCDCGGSGVYYKNNLDNGRTHCGCEANKKPGLSHGMRNHELYSVWSSMLHRCQKPQNAHYSDYGGRGIKVCERWHDVKNFIQDMHPRPKGASLDRINNDGDYEPGNCKWATQKEQRWNQRIPCKIFSNGMNVEQLAKYQKLKPVAIRMRMHRGWTDKEVENGKRDSKK